MNSPYPEEQTIMTSNMYVFILRKASFNVGKSSLGFRVIDSSTNDSYIATDSQIDFGTSSLAFHLTSINATAAKHTQHSASILSMNGTRLA